MCCFFVAQTSADNLSLQMDFCRCETYSLGLLIFEDKSNFLVTNVYLQIKIYYALFVFYVYFDTLVMTWSITLMCSPVPCLSLISLSYLFQGPFDMAQLLCAVCCKHNISISVPNSVIEGCQVMNRMKPCVVVVVVGRILKAPSVLGNVRRYQVFKCSRRVGSEVC